MECIIDEFHTVWCVLPIDFIYCFAEMSRGLI
jgi:hypothetical protein